MILSSNWRGKRYAVLGLARSGQATVRALLAAGAEVIAWDDQKEARDAVASLSGDLYVDDFTDWQDFEFDALVLSPGVPLNRLPLAEVARNLDVPIIGDIELFAQARAELPPHKVVGITGTNGKSTTTALVHHILKTAGVPTTMGGNIGLPILGQEPLPAGGVYVLELSSYQIDLTFTLDCDVAVLLNITPDHLDRYDGFEAYGLAKMRLFQMQSGISHGVICEHGFVGDRGIDEVLGEVVTAEGWTEHWPQFDAAIDWEASMFAGKAAWDGRVFASQSDWPSLQGPHNAQNALSAVTVCRILEVELDKVAEALRTYPGLPHRMERIRERDGVLYVNDSKATNADSTAPALAAYPAIHWIVGGQAKTKDLDACAPNFGHVRAAYAIGEAAPLFVELLTPHMTVTNAGTLDSAVRSAAAAAKPGETVLLSPACASFDQFRSFEDRGDQFRQLVEAL